MLRILLVDDHEDLRVVVAAALGHEHAVFTAADGLEACEVKREVDLVITDLRMPGMSGLDLKRTLESRGLAVLMIMVSSDSDVAEQASKSGFFHFLLKPYTLDDLNASVALAAEYIATRATAPRSP